METPSKKVEAYAGFVIRVFAFIIDSIIISAIVLAFFIFIVPYLYHPFPILYNILSGPLVSDNYSFLLLNMVMVWMAFFLIIQCFYVTILESFSYQGTFGKILLGLSVIDNSGNRISIMRAFVRGLGLIISFLLFCIGNIFILFTRNKQGLHDMIAGTYVIHRAENSDHPYAKKIAAIALIAGLGFILFWPLVLSAVLPNIVETTNPDWDKTTVKGDVAVSVNKTDNNHINITFLGGPDEKFFTNLQVYVTDADQKEQIFWLKPQLSTNPIPVGTVMTINGSFNGTTPVRVNGHFHEGASYLSYMIYNNRL
jgi:uncharacterized RDD family membrane protein YckC